MDIPGRLSTFPALMMKTAAPIAVAFREVRHDRPDDALHVEPLVVRGALHDWRIPAHRHEGLHQFLWLRQGAAVLQLDGVPHALQAPALVMITPGCVHALQFEPGSDGWQVTVPSARLARLGADAPVLAARLASPRLLQGAAHAEALAGAETQVETLAREFHGQAPGRAEVLQAQALLLAATVLRATDAAADGAARPAPLRDTLVTRYRALLDAHVRQQPKLAFYADTLGVTPDHLSRCCRAVCGSSALELLHERRLDEARRLLARTAAAVGEVADELGFADPAYFSRFFARHAGLSPQAYRAAVQRGIVAAP